MTPKLQFGVSTAAFFPQPLETTLDMLAQQPWRSIELMPQTPDECRPDFARTLLDLGNGRFQFCAIHFPQILAPFLYNAYPGAFAYGQQLCRDLGELAGALGCTAIVVHAPWANMSSGVALEATLANFRLLCDVCLPHNVLVALENTPSAPLSNSPETMVEFAQMVDRPNLSFTVDITHAYQLGQDPMIYLESLPEIAHVHASDYNTARHQRHTAPGDGVVAWPAVIAALRARGFQGNFVLELLPQTLGDDPVQTLRQCTALLDPLFADWA
ncbi:MAG: sugar phosphate isomerase/epimerase [Caldilineaceae bacterium]|nr:sugar phosphate isomerase/epimerase [Caldilineaceae bacterium]